MRKEKQSNINGIINLFLCAFAMGFAVFAPFQGAVSEMIPKVSVISLGMGCIFVGLLCVTTIFRKEVVRAIRWQPLLFALMVVTVGITTVKYGIDLKNGTASTFFVYYAVPAYIAAAFALAVWLQKEKSYMYVMMQLYNIAFCLLYVIYSERFLLDIGGIVRSVGNYENPNELGVYAFCALGFSACLLVKHQFSNCVNILTASIAVVAVLLSESRTALGAVIGFAASVFILTLRYKLSEKKIIREKGKNFLLRIFLRIIAFTVISIGIYIGLRPNLLMITDIRGEAYTYEGREELIKKYPQLREPMEELLASMDLQDSEKEYSVQETDETGPKTSSLKKVYISPWKSLLDRFIDSNNTDQSSIFSNLRFKIWLGYLRNVEDYWAFGAETGFMSVKPVIDRARDCHNTWLYLFVQYGLVTAVISLWIIVHLFKALIFHKNDNVYSIPLNSMLVGFMVFLAFNDLANVPVFWMLLAILCCLSRNSGKQEQKRIAIVRRYGGFGGIEHQIANICKGLSEQGMKVYLITDAESVFSQACSSEGATVEIMTLDNFIVSGLKLEKFCRKNYIDILQTHMLFESMAGRVARFFNGNTYHVFRVHTYIDCSHIPVWKKNLYHIIAFLTEGQVDRYAVINSFNRKEMVGRSHILERKISVIHDGVKSVGDVHRQEDCSEIRLAMVANFVPWKGHDILVKGIELLRKQGMNVKAYLYGACPGEGTPEEDRTVLNEIGNMIQDRKLEEQIHFCGYTKEIDKAMEGIFALVLPSYAEGTPNCVLEAMSLRVLTICSSVGGVPEFVIDGISGYSHIEGDAQAFSEAVIRAVRESEEQRQKILDYAYQLWHEEYTVERLIENLTLLYKRL